MNVLVSFPMLPRIAGGLFTLALFGSAFLAPAARAHDTGSDSSGKPSVYSGEAIGVHIDGVVNPAGLDPIVIADTDSLPGKGGVKSATKTKVSVGGGGLKADGAGSLATGVLNQSLAASAVTNFHAEFITEDGDHLIIEADYIGATASAGGNVEGRLKADTHVVIRGLKIDGKPVAVTGQANQEVLVGESRIYLNEQATSVDGKNADASVAAIHFYTCSCVEGWLARVHAGFTLGDSAPAGWGPGCGR